MNDNIRDALIKKGANTNLIEWIEFIYPTLIKLISPINLDNVLLEYEIELVAKNDKESKVDNKLMRNPDRDISGVCNSDEKYIQLLVEDYDNIGVDAVLSLVHELGHASCTNEKQYRFNLTNSGFLNTCYIEESYVEFLKKSVTNDFKIVKSSELDIEENKRKCFALLNSKGDEVQYCSYTKTYSQCQPLYFLIECILGKDKKMINEFYNAKNPEDKESLFRDIRKTLNGRLSDEQIEELYDDIYIGYICCSDYNKEVSKEDKLSHIHTSYSDGKVEPELLESCEQWIEKNNEIILGDIIEKTGRFTENILLSRFDNLENEDVLDLARDLAYYINHVDISGNEENRIKLMSRFYSMCKAFESKGEINCYNYTDEQITGMLLGVLANRCIRNSEIRDLKILNPEKFKKRIENFNDSNIAISIGDDYYQYTVNVDTNRNNATFGLIGNGLNNKITEQRDYPDGIRRGNPNYDRYVKISKEIDINGQCI